MKKSLPHFFVISGTRN